MRAYAGRIGADYRFETNPRFVTNLGSFSPHYGSFKPIYDDSFLAYDKVLYVDLDVFAVEGLGASIFDGFEAEIGICTEPFQPTSRQKATGYITGAQDERWAAAIKARWDAEMPRTPEGLLKVYNSGVVLYSARGLSGARERFAPFREYVDLVSSAGLSSFYTADQNYLHAMLPRMDYVELDNGWNSYVHYTGDPKLSPRPVNDSRTPDTKFVHVQLRGADHFAADKLWRIVNRPQGEWG
jgi:lipopolysaccharide biosynthesis glycosyltransferase